jgi:hypothetical protein
MLGEVYELWEDEILEGGGCVKIISRKYLEEIEEKHESVSRDSEWVPPNFYSEILIPNVQNCCYMFIAKLGRLD